MSSDLGCECDNQMVGEISASAQVLQPEVEELVREGNSNPVSQKKNIEEFTRTVIDKPMITDKFPRRKALEDAILELSNMIPTESADASLQLHIDAGVIDKYIVDLSNIIERIRLLAIKTTLVADSFDLHDDEIRRQLDGLISTVDDISTRIYKLFATPEANELNKNVKRIKTLVNVVRISSQDARGLIEMHQVELVQQVRAYIIDRMQYEVSPSSVITNVKQNLSNAEKIELAFWDAKKLMRTHDAVRDAISDFPSVKKLRFILNAYEETERTESEETSTLSIDELIESTNSFDIRSLVVGDHSVIKRALDSVSKRLRNPDIFDRGDWQNISEALQHACKIDFAPEFQDIVTVKETSNIKRIIRHIEACVKYLVEANTDAKSWMATNSFGIPYNQIEELSIANEKNYYEKLAPLKDKDVDCFEMCTVAYTRLDDLLLYSTQRDLQSMKCLWRQLDAALKYILQEKQGHEGVNFLQDAAVRLSKVNKETHTWVKENDMIFAESQTKLI